MAKVLICCHGADGIQFLGIDTPYGVRSWDKLRPIAEAAGFVVVVLDLGNDNFHNADLVDDAIMARPAGDEIYLLAHSMGGLSARLCLKRYDARGDPLRPADGALPSAAPWREVCRLPEC